MSGLSLLSVYDVSKTVVFAIHTPLGYDKRPLPLACHHGLDFTFLSGVPITSDDLLPMRWDSLACCVGASPQNQTQITNLDSMKRVLRSLIADQIFEILKTTYPTIQKEVNGQIEKFFIPKDLIFSRSRNQQHPTVQAIQFKLVNLGYSLNADKIYGTKTEDAVARFQASQGLETDGIVGPDTMAAMFGPQTEE